jgi:hypothetical protein
MASRGSSKVAEDLCVFNGIDGTTGDYLVPPMSAEEVLAILTQRPYRPTQRAMMPGLDPRNLAESGWGVIFHRTADPAVHKALGPLLRHRHQQAKERYREFTGTDGYRDGDDSDDFLSRFGMAPGPVNPKRMPYYLLIVGDPETIPYSFQTQLDVQYAVGRIWFDTPEQYARYAESVVAAEKGAVTRERRFTLFGVRNRRDPATKMSADSLVKPLAKNLRRAEKSNGGWDVQTHLAATATKSRLGSIFQGEGSPALLFTASHGMGFPNGDPRQLDSQGALLCQDWPGRGKGPVEPEHYFAAADLPDDADVAGLVAFCFACHGGGTPRLDDFSHRNGWQPREIAPRAFVSRLPQRLLAHPKGGALAVIGHVERAWSHSFLWRTSDSQTEVFESTLGLLRDGYPVGAAMEYLNQRYAELSSLLTRMLQRIQTGETIDPQRVSALWTAQNDARSYVVVGDPAVRLAVSSASSTLK